MAPSADTFMARVTAATTPAPGLRVIELAAAEGGQLPGFPPGAHVSVRIPPRGPERPQEMWRSYSLVAFPDELPPIEGTPRTLYRLGVLREAAGKGGSRYMHDELRVGDFLTLRLPPNGFPLQAPRDGIHLVAGGIGITPLVTMASALSNAGVDCVLHYTCRQAAHHLFTDRLGALAGCDVRLYADEDPAGAFSVAGFLDGLAPATPLYICGPAGLIDAVTQGALARGWDPASVHSEVFAEATPLPGDAPFQVRLASSGAVLDVPADKSLLDVLIAEGAFVMYDCRQGHCGLCSVPVLSGQVLHRDIFLAEDQRAAGDVMQACVSRGVGLIELDL